MTAAAVTSHGWRWFAQRSRRIARLCLDALYPPLCLTCRTQVSEPRALCSACWNQLTFFSGAVCICCGVPFEFDPGAESTCAACLSHPPAFDRARAALAYDDASKKAILAFKRADRLEFSDLFASWMRQAGQELISETDLIIPVPLHRWRLWLRRYNQSAILARRLATRCMKPFDPFVLIRTRSTPSQGTMVSPKARVRNMRGAFQVPSKHRHLVQGRRILLVDDVLTTGATLMACTRALKRAGAAKVFVLTVARVARPLPEGV